MNTRSDTQNQKGLGADAQSVPGKSSPWQRFLGMTAFHGILLGVALAMGYFINLWCFIVPLFVFLAIVVCQRSWNKLSWIDWTIAGIIILIPIATFFLFVQKPATVAGILYEDVNGNGEQDQNEKSKTQESVFLISEHRLIPTREAKTDDEGHFIIEIPDERPTQVCLELLSLAMSENIQTGRHLALSVGIYAGDDEIKPPKTWVQRVRELLEEMWSKILKGPIEGIIILALILIIVVIGIILIVHRHRQRVAGRLS